MKKTLALMIVFSGLPSTSNAMEKNAIFNQEKLIDSINYSVLATIKKNLNSSIIQIKISSDAAKITILDNSRDISLWNAISGELIEKKIGQAYGDQIIGFNDTGTAVTVIGTGRMDSYPIISPTAIEAIKQKLGNWHVILKRSLNSDGTKIAVYDTSRKISVWDANSGESIQEELTYVYNVQSIKFNDTNTEIIITTPLDIRYYTIK